jgi:hypothetical protein
MKQVRMVLMAAVALLAVGAFTAPRQASAQAPAAEVASPAANLRVELAEMLSEHAALALVGLQKRYDNAPDYPAAAVALEMNTMAVTDMVRAVYGDAAAARFMALWDFHIENYVLYTDGRKMNDAAMMGEARDNLNGFVQDISALLASANPYLSRPALEQAYRMHVDQTAMAVDAYAARDFTRVYDIAHEAHLHIAMTGWDLAAAIARQFPARFPGDPMAPAATFRAVFVDALTEHAALAGLATQKVFDGAPDTAAVVGQLDENTIILTAHIQALYGQQAAEQFLRLWRDHIQFFADYTMGWKMNDAAMRQRAQQGLAGYVTGISALLAGANPNLPRPVLEQAFTAHVQQLAGAVDAYAAREFDETYMLMHEAHMHMVMSGTVLSGGIVAQFPNLFVSQAGPVRLPNTGDGGCHHDC